MANVFGNDITNSTLERMPEYTGKVITRKERARVALDMKNTGDKYTCALQYAERLNREFSDGLATKCLIYNATGDTVTFMKSHDWPGHIVETPPVQIENGQWGAFLHVRERYIPSGSCAAVVYRGMNQNDDSCEWMLSWSNPCKRESSDNGVESADNTVYSEIREAGHYDADNWEYIRMQLYASSKYQKDTWNGCTSTVRTGTGYTVSFEGIMTLENV